MAVTVKGRYKCQCGEVLIAEGTANGKWINLPCPKCKTHYRFKIEREETDKAYR